LPANVALAALTIQSIDGGAESPTWKAVSVNAKGFGSSEADGQKLDKLESGAVTVTDVRNGAVLSLERAEMEAARWSALDELSAQGLRAESLRLRSDKPDWPARLTVTNVQVAAPMVHRDGSVELGPVVAEKPYFIFARAKDGDWMWPPLPGAGGSGTAASGGRENSPFRVASVSSRGPGRIAFIDHIVAPAVQLHLDPVVFAMQNLDTRLPGSVSHFRIRGTGYKFADLTMDGKLTMRLDGVDLGLKLHLNGIDVPELNAYSGKYENIEVDAGRADAYTDLTIENDVLRGKVDVLLSGLEVNSAIGGGAFRSINPLNVPTRTALALLKDRQGNISLTIPLQARTEAPNYDFINVFRNSFVRTVTTAGSMAASLPGKSLDGAMQLLEGTISLLPGVGAERYAPVAFDDGTDSFTAEPLIYLDQLGQRMQRREALVLALCGRSVSKDENAVGGQELAVGKLFDEASKGVYPVYAPGRDGLLALAEGRADAVRRYLRDIHRIPERRLLPCEARIDADAGAKPRVELQVKTPAGSKGLFDLFF